jgi:hypothetical protein
MPQQQRINNVLLHAASGKADLNKIQTVQPKNLS